MINSYRPNKTAVIKKTILSDQLSSLSEGAMANIWLVLAQPKSPPGPPTFNPETLLDDARLALDSEIALDSGTCARLNGCVRILWSLT